MRSHFEHDLFGCTPFPHQVGPWGRGFGADRGFGPWSRGFGADRGFGPWGRGFGACGRSEFGFGRPGCGPHGPPGCTQGCERRNRPEHSHERSPSPTPREGDDERPTATEHDGDGNGSPVNDCPEQTRCKHHGTPGCDQNHGFRGHKPCGGGPMRGNHHHHWPRPPHHGFGSRPDPVNLSGWLSYGCGHPGPHWNSSFGHRRPSPYDRHWGHFTSRDCGDCHSRPGCSGKKDSKECKIKKSGRKENGPCCSKDKDQNTTGDTVLIQRIIVETPTRPQSV